jgi:DNA repair exonuclease SbcCD nuclease subunit
MPLGYGNRRRQALREVFHEIMRRAAEWPADAVLIAGDLFDIDRVNRDTVAFLREVFELVRPIPVFIAPGNHDPFVPSSPYATEAWPANVFIFEGPEWSARELVQPPLTVHGFAFDGADISANPFGLLEIPDDGRIHVALAHGYARDATPNGLHYLALGHYHCPMAIPGEYSTSVHYAGAPEGHDFNETGMRYCLEVEIDESAAVPQVEVRQTPSSKTIYRNHSVDCTELADSQQIVDALRRLAQQEPLPQVAQVTLTGVCRPEVRQELPGIYDAAAEAFAFLELVNETGPAEDYLALARESTSLGLFVRRISEEIRDAPDENRRAMLIRARETGLAAYRGCILPVRGLESENR